MSFYRSDNGYLWSLFKAIITLQEEKRRVQRGCEGRRNKILRGAKFSTNALSPVMIADGFFFFASIAKFERRIKYSRVIAAGEQGGGKEEEQNRK